MNQQQLKYAQKRAEEIFERRLAALKKSLVVKEVNLSFEEQIKALKAGEFSVVVPKDSWRRSISECIKFHGEKASDTSAFDKASSKLHKEYRRLLDELVLGDNDIALSMLQKFDVE